MAPGQIAFLGSGETSLAGGRIFESLARRIKDPLRIALLETPAGFELNSSQVVGRVGDFMKTRLQNYKPVVDVIPARKKNSTFSPDDPEVVKPLLYANMIFMGNTFATKYDTLTDEEAAAILKEKMAIEKEREALKQKYTAKIAKVLPDKKALRYAQVETRIQLMLGNELYSMIPLAR